MRKYWIFLLAILFIYPGCQKEDKDLFTIGLFQVDDAPTLNAVRKGFLSALEEAELQDGVNIRMVIRNGMGSIPEVQRIAHEFVSSKVDLIVPLSTPCRSIVALSYSFPPSRYRCNGTISQWCQYHSAHKHRTAQKDHDGAEDYRHVEGCVTWLMLRQPFDKLRTGSAWLCTATVIPPGRPVSTWALCPRRRSLGV